MVIPTMRGTPAVRVSAASVAMLRRADTNGSNEHEIARRPRGGNTTARLRLRRVLVHEAGLLRAQVVDARWPGPDVWAGMLRWDVRQWKGSSRMTKPGPRPNLCDDPNCRCHMQASPTSQSWRLGGMNTELGASADQRRERAARLKRESRARLRGNG